MALDNALPWFPLTPEYIDRYHDDVLKYLRDSFEHEDSELNDDRSFATTSGLLVQRAAQIREQHLGGTLLDGQSLPGENIQRDARVIASAAIHASRFDRDATLRHLSLLCYLLALDCPEMSDVLATVCLRCMKASSVGDPGFTMDDVIAYDVPSLVRKMEDATMVESGEEMWYQDHGTIRMTRDGMEIYPMNRLFLSMKMTGSNALKEVLTVDSGEVRVYQDRKSAKNSPFDLGRYLRDCDDVVPDEEKVTLKTYADGDRLSVRVMYAGYDKITAGSIDPAYEPLVRDIRILGASNVRGLYMTDFARNLHMGRVINVKYEEKVGCFSIDDTVLDFIHDEYWNEREDGSRYENTDAILLFPHSGEIPNTWLTREGFLVRTEDGEKYPRYTKKNLDIVEYDEKYDFIIAEITDDEPGEAPIDEMSARDSFIGYLIYKNRLIMSPAAVRPKIRLLDRQLVTEFHRIEAIRHSSVPMSTSMQKELLSVCAILSCITGDDEDRGHYAVMTDYLTDRVLFAQSRFSEIASLDRRGITAEKVKAMGVMVEILRQYGKDEESEIISLTIDKLSGTSLGAVAKLVQAANRFMGTPSLDRLRVDLHREICANLGVIDSVIVDEEDGDGFPFRPEGPEIEHKMSWVFDNETGEFNVTSQSFKCLKTVCAFMNRYQEQGDAHLYIGTDEKRRFVCGFQNDIDKMVEKGELEAKGDLDDEFFRKIILNRIQEKFPDTYHCVDPSIICDGKVIDICVHPAKEGVVYLNGTAYYRFGSKSKEMTKSIEEEIRSRKFLMRSGIADKIDAVRRAVYQHHTVSLEGYDSSNSNTSGKDRKVEAFAFTDSDRCEAIWAFDPKDRMNKVFLLKRTDSIKVLDEEWKHEAMHRTYDLDILGFSGDERIDLDMVLRTTRAKNQFVETYPSAEKSLERTGDGGWRVRSVLYNRLSLEAACGFYLSLSSEVGIGSCEALKEIVSRRVEAILTDLG